MKPPLVLAMTAWKRPEYLREVLESLAATKWIEYCLFLANVEPGYPDVVQLLKDFRACPTDVVMNDELLGCPANTLAVLQRGFDEDEFVLHLEDDLTFAPDALQMVQWMRYEYEGQQDEIACIGLKSSLGFRPSCTNKVRRSSWFACHVWGTWQEEWETNFLPNWEQKKLHEPGYRGWGHTVNEKIMQGRSQILPVLSRVQHIGLHGGTHATPETFEADYAPDFEMNFLGITGGPYAEISVIPPYEEPVPLTP